MRILVCVASRHGSTDHIGRAIAAELRRTLEQSGRGHDVDVLHVQQVGDITAYDAVIVGSAVYRGRWLASAEQFVRRHARELRTKQVWLFSSGRVGSTPWMMTSRPAVSSMLDLTGARGHQTFGGTVAMGRLTYGEKAIARMVGAVGRDFRDWSKIIAWARDIAADLRISESTAHGA